MKHLFKVVAVPIVLCAAVSALVAEPVFNGKPISQVDIGAERVYQVNKYVKDFPDKEDMSTPESANSVFARMLASGEMGRWKRLSCKETAARLPGENTPRSKVNPQVEAMYSGAKIQEVRIWHGDYAAVISKVVPAPGYHAYDTRFVQRENGQWLNRGQGNDYDTLEAARATVETAWREKWYDLDVLHREKVADPAAYLRPYVDFLKSDAQDPRAFTMDALKKHQLVIMGEVHNRPLQWEFNSSVATDPEFANTIGTIYMELPMNDQESVDEFLASSTADPEPIIKTLRDVFEHGWPSQAWLDFFMTVWMVNRDLPESERIRVVCVDMQRPWDKIQKREDWKPYDVDRNKLMADNLLADIRKHPEEKRHRLFIVGFAHAMLDLYHFAENGPRKSAGWHLSQALGDENVYAIFPHGPSQTNGGYVSGRLCLGLFDSAFAELGNKPMAFTLDKGPFGQQIFDAAPDFRVCGHYSDGFNAYLYLGPPEYEIYSPVIAGFYTPEFIKEIDRRTRVMYGRSWSDMAGKELTVENVLKFMDSWGKPQSWTTSLGPKDAWQYGDGWKLAVMEKTSQDVKAHPELIAGCARKVLAAISRIDWPQSWNIADWQHFLPDADYDCEWMDEWTHWMFNKFKDDPIKSIDVGETLSWKMRPGYHAETETPSVGYKLTLQDGATLEGDMAFFYDPLQQKWWGFDGLNWHKPPK